MFHLETKERIAMMRARPGRAIARAAVGTAVIAGTAGAVHHAQDQRWQRKEQEAYQAQATQQQLADQQAQIEQMQAQQQYAPPPQQQYAPPPPPAQSATMQQLQQLAQMHDAGILSDEEFASAKQKVLSGG
jgi:transcription initiation factor TFIID subunit TAF12